MKPDRIDIERWRYWQGQELRGRDFRDQMRSEAQLRWWHNRALHNAFGARYGLTVSGVFSQHALVAVRIECGVAYDCFGRELILQSAREIPFPQPGLEPSQWTLVVRYKRMNRRADLDGACAPCGDTLSIEQPEFVWKLSTRVDFREGVPLAHLSYELQGGLLVPVLTNRPQVARPFARPRIGSGATIPEGTAWELWLERLMNLRRNIQEVALGYQVIVDTSAAGFTETPCYFAWLEGTIWQTGGGNVEFFPVPLAHIDAESPTQFRFRVWLPMTGLVLGARLRISNSEFESEFINFARRQKLYVCWVGIQPSPAEMAEPGCVAVSEPECYTDAATRTAL